MRAIYFASDPVLADGLKRQLAGTAPGADLEINVRADEAHTLLASGGVDAVLIDTGLPDQDTAGVIAAIRHHNLPLVVIVAAASAARTSAFWALQADFVWGCDADMGYSLSPERFAPEVSVAIHRAAERRRADDSHLGDPVRVVYIGDDEQVRELLNNTPAICTTSADDPECHVAVIDASPYDAIRSVRTLCAVAPALPMVLLCGADIHGADDIAYVLGIDRVLVKSGNWLPQLLTMVRNAADQRQRAVHGQHGRTVAERPASDHDSGAGSLQALSEPGTNGPAIAHGDDRVPSSGGVHGGDLRRSIQESTHVDAPDAEAKAGAEWRGRLEALTARQQQELAAHQTRHDELQRQLDEARAGDARATSTLEAERAEWRAQLEALTAHQQRELAGERAEGDELALRLNAKHDELRRTARLSELAAGVVAELDSFIGEVAAQTACPDETASPFGIQPERPRRTAERALDLVRRFQVFRRAQAEPPEPTDLSAIIRDLAPTLQLLIGSDNELLLQLESTAALVSLSRRQIQRLLFSLAVLCGDALPIGGQVIVGIMNVEAIPSWDTCVPRARLSLFVRVTVTISGHVPKPMRATPSIESLMQECDGHCDEITTDDRSTGLCIHLPRYAGAQQG